MQWQLTAQLTPLTVRELFRLVLTVRFYFNRQGHVVGRSVGLHRPILHGPTGPQGAAFVSIRTVRVAGGHITI
jgi:hypothetical protein